MKTDETYSNSTPEASVGTKRIPQNRTLRFLGFRTPIPALLLGLGIILVVAGFFVSHSQVEGTTPSQHNTNPNGDGTAKTVTQPR